MTANKRICACANPDCPTVGVYEPDSACPLCGMRMLFAPGIELENHPSIATPLIQACREFLQNVRNHNVAGLGDLACDPSLKQMESALRELVGCLEVLTVAAELKSGRAVEICHGHTCGGCLECMYAQCRQYLEQAEKQIEHTQLDTEMGKQWRENSSLEKWFPFTAEENGKLRSLVTEIFLVASGEKQVAHDDTAALAWIAERCKQP